ncbi:acyltransferase family protein [Paenibacillus alvei]|uniref:Acyltransferase family protein n=1 Tax=Paenibacillus alvei TaxID=44250 RepID=A0ABT4GUQ8_PAEAL|nr:acyltransferase family protein [Paenibacillus alvei]MCY9760433.1 acyltransferase family protein [Paenibacillus alvei]MCY9767725.1 acyltransferase family protein [Paenibacillus alvei]
MKRNIFLDNAKVILIILVVVGHYLDRVIWMGDSSWYTPSLIAINTVITSFHMPAFILISGYFYSITNLKENLNKILYRLVIPFIIFELLYGVFERFVLPQHKSVITWHTPYWILWFLFSTAIWYLLMPYIMKLKHPLTFSIIISVIAGCVDTIGYQFSLSRTLYFLPFFIVGYYLKTNGNIKFLINRKIATIILASSVVTVVILNPDSRWFYGSFSYLSLEATTWYSSVFRLAAYSFSSLMIITFLSLVPKRKVWITKFGFFTLYCYLLHGFVIRIAMDYGLFETINSFKMLIFYLISAIGIAIILMTKPVVSLTKVIVEPHRLYK